MIYIIRNKDRRAHWLPVDFEAINRREAQDFMQVWADRLQFGPLVFEWSADECSAFFWSNGVRYRFCTLINSN